jgi:hypothetical protein
MHTMPTHRISACAAVLILSACGGDNTDTRVDAPGSEESARTRVLEAGAAVLQDKAPIDAINTYLDGFHFYNGNLRGQMEAHHYCAILNEDLIQCVIYDGNGRQAKLMGVEYIVSAKLFASLPDEEKSYWHSHVHEVKSGMLIAPGIPDVAELALMKKIVGTYGKTLHTWHTDLQKELPVGIPQVMMGFTRDGQVDPALVADRDQRFGTSTGKEKQDRASIEAPAILPGADAWEAGTVRQLADPAGREHQHGARDKAP